MAKSVLGNDPFQTAAVVTEKPKAAKKVKSTVKKSTTKSKPKATAKKTVSKKTDKSSGKAAKSTKKKATGKTTAAAKPSTKVKADAEKMLSTDKNTESNAVNKLVVDEAVKEKVAASVEIKQSRPVEEKTRASVAEQTPVVVTETANPVKYDAEYTAKLRPEDFTIGQEYGFDPKFRKKISPILDLLYRIFWRVTVKGIENIPEEGKAVLVSNHAGILPFDGLILNAALRKKAGREVWPLIEDFFYYAPVLGSLLSKAGCVRACQENAQRLLAEDEMVAVFPEGIKGIVKPYRSRYRLQRFGRGGFVKLCLNTDSPVIPVAIVGSEESHPLLFNFSSLAKILKLPYFPVTPLFPLLGPLGLVPLPNKWTIVIGAPLYINQFGPETAGDRVAVNRLSAKIKSQIQKMIDMEIGQRGSRWK